MSDHKAEFWERLGKSRAGMLSVGKGQFMPMSPNLRDEVDDGVIWFISAKGTEWVDATQNGPTDARFVVSDDKTGLYADVKGTLELSNDQDALDDVWGAVASAWFEDDRQDPDLRLLAFKPQSSETSITSTSGIKFLYGIARANLTDAKPDMGWQGQISF